MYITLHCMQPWGQRFSQKRFIIVLLLSFMPIALLKRENRCSFRLKTLILVGRSFLLVFNLLKMPQRSRMCRAVAQNRLNNRLTVKRRTKTWDDFKKSLAPAVGSHHFPNSQQKDFQLFFVGGWGGGHHPHIKSQQQQILKRHLNGSQRSACAAFSPWLHQSRSYARRFKSQITLEKHVSFWYNG